MPENDTRIETFGASEPLIAPSEEFRAKARVRSAEQYEEMYRESLDHPDTFWSRETEELVFREPHHTLCEWKLPFAKWFVGAKLNATESCLDRYLAGHRRDKPAIIWESEPGETVSLSYQQLYDKVVAMAAALRAAGVKSGDRVAIYMGMVPEAVVGMLACARIGAPHTVVFGGFAAESLRDRVNDCAAKVVLTQDGGWRKGNVLPLKAIVDQALEGCASVHTVFVYRRLGNEHIDAKMKKGRDVDWYQAAHAADPEQGGAEIVDAEHPLFILYTSGSTGKPKGIKHTTAGYLAGAHVSTKYVFDLQEDDIYWCTADVGWITGHSYLTYGPLSNGTTCLMYEGAPNAPDWGRFWSIIEKHKVNILYTAPTAIRAFIKQGDQWLDKHDLSSLRLLGTVGEPINPEAWHWYYTQVGRERCPVVDTWWQTETGSILLTTLPGAHKMKPGSAGLPFFGVSAECVTSDGKPLQGNEGGLLVLTKPWPSIMRTVWGDDDRFQKQYFSDVPGCYFTGDGAHRDADGYYTVVGRIDDVLNVSGHRIGTAEIESVLVGHQAVAEAAAVGRPDDLTGQALVVFVTLKPNYQQDEAMKQTLRQHVAHGIGKFAQPASVRFADGLPKTRSGKIMRRLLKDIAAGRDTEGDTSTLEDASVLEKLRQG